MPQPTMAYPSTNLPSQTMVHTLLYQKKISKILYLRLTFHSQGTNIIKGKRCES
jgi:hypothetical protein